MTVNGRNKGASFERQIAKQLTSWSGMEFNRTPSSGGLHWKQNSSVSGDIVAPDTISFPFSIELKKQEVPWDFDFLLKGTSVIWSFWEQCEKDASSQGKTPLLIFGKNRRFVYFMMRKLEFSNLMGPIKYKNTDTPYLEINYKKNSFVVADFSRFLELYSLQDVLVLPGNYKSKK